MSTRVSKFVYGSFVHIAYKSSNLDHHYRPQNVLASASGARRLPWVSQLYPTESELFLSFFKSLSTLFFFKKHLLVEYPSFGDEGNSEDLIYWATDSVAGLPVI